MENLSTAAPGKAAVHVHETPNLIASDKVEGTDVYRSSGEKIGSIRYVMIDKYTGQVGYAIMSFGGFLGLGEDHYPLPWSLLKYNERLGGYEVNISDAQLKNAPHFGADDNWDWADPESQRKLREHYPVIVI